MNEQQKTILNNLATIWANHPKIPLMKLLENITYDVDISTISDGYLEEALTSAVSNVNRSVPPPIPNDADNLIIESFDPLDEHPAMAELAPDNHDDLPLHEYVEKMASVINQVGNEKFRRDTSGYYLSGIEEANIAESVTEDEIASWEGDCSTSVFTKTDNRAEADEPTVCLNPSTSLLIVEGKHD